MPSYRLVPPLLILLRNFHPPGNSPSVRVLLSSGIYGDNPLDICDPLFTDRSHRLFSSIPIPPFFSFSFLFFSPKAWRYRQHTFSCSAPTPWRKRAFNVPSESIGFRNSAGFSHLVLLHFLFQLSKIQHRETPTRCSNLVSP